MFSLAYRSIVFAFLRTPLRPRAVLYFHASKTQSNEFAKTRPLYTQVSEGKNRQSHRVILAKGKFCPFIPSVQQANVSSASWY